MRVNGRDFAAFAWERCRSSDAAPRYRDVAHGDAGADCSSLLSRRPGRLDSDRRHVGSPATLLPLGAAAATKRRAVCDGYSGRGLQRGHQRSAHVGDAVCPLEICVVVPVCVQWGRFGALPPAAMGPTPDVPHRVASRRGAATSSDAGAVQCRSTRAPGLPRTDSAPVLRSAGAGVLHAAACRVGAGCVVDVVALTA